MKVITELLEYLVILFLASLLILVMMVEAKADLSLEEPVNIYGGGWSKHLLTGGKYDYNESHNLIGVQYGKAFVGYFKNSYDRDSVALGWQLGEKVWGDFRGQILVGVVRGYRGCYKDSGDSTTICPLLVPMITYTKYVVQPSALLLGEAATVAIGMEF